MGTRRYRSILPEIREASGNAAEQGYLIMGQVLGAEVASRMVRDPHFMNEATKDPAILKTLAGHEGISDVAKDLRIDPEAYASRVIQMFSDNNVLYIATCVEHIETVIIDSDFALSLPGALDRFAGDPCGELPFDPVIFQFTDPIDEDVFFDREPDAQLPEGDKVSAIVVVSHSGRIRAMAWFVSQSTQHVVMDVSTADLLPMNRTERMHPEALRNKRTLALLTFAIVAYINCENVGTERVAPSEKVARRRAIKGKPPIEPYHITYITKDDGYVAPDGEDKSDKTPSGREVSYAFPVRGFMNRFHTKNGIIRRWVSTHWRGVKHRDKSAPERTYRVKKIDV